MTATNYSKAKAADIRARRFKEEYGSFMTLRQLSEELCVSRSTAERLAGENLRCYRIGNVRKYDSREVAKWIEGSGE